MVSIISVNFASVIVYAPVLEIAVVIIPLSVLLLVLQFRQMVIQVIILAEVVTKERERDLMWEDCERIVGLLCFKIVSWEDCEFEM